MSDADWGDIDQVPRKRQGPKVLFCALGCLIPLVLLIASAGYLWVKVDRARDTELQWESLRKLIHYDERPEGWSMELGIQDVLWLEFEFYILTRSGEGVPAAVYFLEPGEDMSPFFDHEKDPDIKQWTPPGADEPLLALEVQGRALRVSRVEGETRKSFFSWGGEGTTVESDEPMIALDLTPEGAAEPIVLFWTQADLDLLTPDEVREFLAPFHVGPER